MKKKIILLLCVFAMTFTLSETIFADVNTLYSEFKNADITSLRSIFMNNFSSFDISKDGNSYNDSQRSLIILEAWQKEFESFDELNRNVTAAAEKLAEKKNNPSLLNLRGYSNAVMKFTAPKETDSKNVFKVDDKEFIMLDKTADSDGEVMFFVMAKDYYGKIAIDPDNFGRWDDSYYRLLPYKLTNQMAFGNFTSGNNIPESILRHLDVLHSWNVEPGSGPGYTKETVLIAPVSIISVTEYIKYGEKIGLDRTSDSFWTRTPVLGTATSHFTVNTSSPAALGKNKGWGGNYLRPVFYLKGSFFKEEEMHECGETVAEYIEPVLAKEVTISFYDGESGTVIENLHDAGSSICFAAEADANSVIDGITPVAVVAVYDKDTAKLLECVFASGSKYKGEFTKYKAVIDISEYNKNEIVVRGFVWNGFDNMNSVTAKAELK